MLRKQPQHSKSRSRSQRQSLGRQRRSTAPSSKGCLPDSTAPELRDDTRYHLDHDSMMSLPTTLPLVLLITAVLLSPSKPPIYFQSPRDIKQALIPIDSNSVNNPDLLLYQRRNIQPTIEQRDEQNNDMSFYDTSYAGSSISSNSIFTSSPELHPARRNRHLPRQDLIDSLPPFHQNGQSYIGSTQSHGVARRKPSPVQSPAAARGRSTTSQDFDFTRRKSQPALPRANRKSPPLSSPTTRRTVRKLGREDCPTISRNNDEFFDDFDHDDHRDADADADADDDGSMPDLQVRSPYDSSDSEDDDDDDDGSMPDLQERSPYCGDSEDDDDNAADDFSGGSTGDFSCDLSGESTGDFSCDSAGDFSCDLSGAPPAKNQVAVNLHHLFLLPPAAVHLPPVHSLVPVTVKLHQHLFLLLVAVHLPDLPQVQSLVQVTVNLHHYLFLPPLAAVHLPQVLSLMQVAVNLHRFLFLPPLAVHLPQVQVQSLVQVGVNLHRFLVLLPLAVHLPQVLSLVQVAVNLHHYLVLYQMIF